MPSASIKNWRDSASGSWCQEIIVARRGEDYTEPRQLVGFPLIPPLRTDGPVGVAARGCLAWETLGTILLWRCARAAASRQVLDDAILLVARAPLFAGAPIDS